MRPDPAALAPRAAQERGGIRGALALAAALLLPTLALRSVWAPDEARYAEVAREMHEHGSFVMPLLYGAPYREKPPLFFWLELALERLGVPLELTPRLLSVAASLALLALLPLLARRSGMTPRSGRRAGFVLATAPLFLAYGQMGLLDASFAACVTASVAAKLSRPPVRGEGRVLWMALEGVALGCALLLKGPVALLFVVGLRLGGALAGGPGPARADRGDIGVLALALAIPALWLVALGFVAGMHQPLDIALGQVARRVSGRAPHHRPPGFLPLVAAATWLPWTVYGLSALGRRPWSWRPVAPLLGWIGLPLLVLSAIPSQQPHYLLPAVAPLALLLGRTTEDPLPRPLARGLGAAGLLLGLALLLAALAPGLALAPLVSDSPAWQELGRDGPLRLALGMAGALVAVLALGPFAVARAATWVRTAAASAVLFAAAVATVWRFDPYYTPTALLRDPQVRQATPLVTRGSLRGLSCLLTRRTDVGVAPDGEELLALLERSPQGVAVVSRGALESADGALRLSERLEEIGRGWFRFRPVSAVRARARAPAAPQGPSAPLR